MFTVARAWPAIWLQNLVFLSTSLTLLLNSKFYMHNNMLKYNLDRIFLVAYFFSTFWRKGQRIHQEDKRSVIFFIVILHTRQ